MVRSRHIFTYSVNFEGCRKITEALEVAGIHAELLKVDEGGEVGHVVGCYLVDGGVV